MYNPKVSIVIPVYNGSNYLEKAIESALSQTYQNIEVIVINDGSNDNGATALIAAKYKERIRYYEKRNGGSSSALNYGIQKMEGEWFSWLSHDDLYYPNKVQREIEYLMQMDVEEDSFADYILFSGHELINENGMVFHKSPARKMKKIANEITQVRGNEFLIAQPRKFNFHGCSCLIHRSVFERVGLFDEGLRILNDVEMWFRVYEKGLRVCYVPEILVKGRIHAQQVGRSIGYSSQHPENDMLWGRRLEWLIKNHPNNYRLFVMLGRDAYMCARYMDGDNAFQIARTVSSGKKVNLILKKNIYSMYSKSRTVVKKLLIESSFLKK